MSGTAFEFLRNSAMDPRNFFDVENARAPTPVPPFKRHQFGGALGGPLRKDKTFLFGNYEGFRQRLAISDVTTVPDENERKGVLPCNLIYTTPANEAQNFANRQELLEVTNLDKRMLTHMDVSTTAVRSIFGTVMCRT